MKAYEAITELLSEAGVDTIFTLQSDGNMRMLAHVHGERSDEFRLIKARHEQAAMAMADGYSRVSDDVCVCTVGRGPAVAQTGTALVTAHRRGSGFLVLLPDSATTSAHDIKGFAQEAFLETTVENVVSVRSRENVLRGVREGLRRIGVGEGPVAVEIAQDVLNGDLGSSGGLDSVGRAETDAFDRGRSGGFQRQVRPDEERIEAAVDLFLESDATKPPIVLAGRGAVRSDARAAIETLAERTNALLATTVQGRGYFDDHPFSLGFVGHYGGRLANEYVMDSGYVLAVGCGLNPYTTDEGHLFDEDAKLVHVDADPAAIERHTPVDLGIVGDVAATIEAIEGELERRGIDRTGEFWTDAVRTRLANDPPFDEDEFPERPGTIDPRELLGELNRTLPENRTVVSDTGHHTRWVLDGVETPTPDDLVWPAEFGSIGLGVPVGIGAALAAEEKTCVTICGDAGFMMADHEVETAARHGVPIVVVVMNDAALGTEYHSLDRYGDHADVSVIETPNLADVAEAMGAEGYTVRSVSDLRDLEGKLGRKPAGPIVLDCKVNREVVHRSKM